MDRRAPVELKWERVSAPASASDASTSDSLSESAPPVTSSPPVYPQVPHGWPQMPSLDSPTNRAGSFVYLCLTNVHGGWRWLMLAK